jgi:hypothetical protein
LAEYPYEIVRQAWRWITAGVMLAGVAALLPLGRHLGATIRLWRWAAFVIVVAASTATVVSLMMGQTTAICFAGFCCFASAYVRKSAALMAAALVLLALKPTLMLPVCAFLLTEMFWQRSILAAAAMTFVMAFPALYAHGFTATLLGFLNEIARYELLPENFPPAETGVRNLLYHAFGVSVPVLLLVVIAAAMAAALGFLCRTPVLTRDRAFHAFTVVALVAALVPFHVYDVVFIAPLVLLCAGWLPPLQGLVLAIVALSQRVGNIQRTLTGFGLAVGGELDFPGSAIFSLAILLVFGIAVTRCLCGASTRKTYAAIG